MRAAIVKKFGAPECIEILTNLPIPDVTDSDQMLVRVKSSGVNPVDTYIRSGNYGSLPNLPYTPGRDGAGIIEKIGSGVTRFKPGDRVWFTFPITGSAADYTIANSKIYNLSEKLTFEEGSRLGIPYMTAYRALFLLGHAKKGDNILIHGASGSVGIAACQLGAWKGLNVVGTAGTVGGINLVKNNGAQCVFDHKDPNYVSDIKRKFPQGFDLILEMASHINLSNDLTLLSKGGKVAIIGCRGDININPRLLMGPETSIFGVALGQTTKDEYDHMGCEITKFLEETGFKPIIHKSYPLEKIGESHKDIIENTGTLGSLVINL